MGICSSPYHNYRAFTYSALTFWLLGGNLSTCSAVGPFKVRTTEIAFSFSAQWLANAHTYPQLAEDMSPNVYFHQMLGPRHELAQLGKVTFPFFITGTMSSTIFFETQLYFHQLLGSTFICSFIFATDSSTSMDLFIDIISCSCFCLRVLLSQAAFSVVSCFT